MYHTSNFLKDQEKRVLPSKV